MSPHVLAVASVTRVKQCSQES